MLLYFNLSFALHIHGVSNALFQLVGVEQEGLSSVEMAQKQWHVPAFHLASTVAKESTEDRGSCCPGHLFNLSGHHPTLSLAAEAIACVQGLVNETVEKQFSFCLKNGILVKK